MEGAVRPRSHEIRVGVRGAITVSFGRLPAAEGVRHLVEVAEWQSRVAQLPLTSGSAERKRAANVFACLTGSANGCSHSPLPIGRISLQDALRNTEAAAEP